MKAAKECLLLVVLCALVLPVSTRAQGGATGAISGVVLDERGGAIPGAQVVVTNTATGQVERTVETGAAGNFNVPSLQPSVYRLEITAKGFTKFILDKILVQVTETSSVTATLKVGEVTQSVVVTESIAPVQTSNATTGTTIGEHTVSNLPISTGNFFGLLSLSAGANTELFDSAALGRGSVTLNVNGQRPSNNNYQIEGVNVNDVNLPVLDNVALPNKESIEEFKTQTSLYDASQGRNGGGNVQVNLRSGTNQYHGETYEFFRNNVFNANDWFLNASTPQIPRPVLRQNLFGANFGGPAPKIKDWFFYLSYQGTREISGASAGTQISTKIPIIPASRDQATLVSTFFPGGLPSGFTQLDPTALKWLNLPASKCPGFNDGTHCIPTLSGVAGLTDGAVNTTLITRALPGTYQEDQYIITTDKQITSRDKFSGRWFFADTSTVNPFGNASTLAFAENLPLSNRFLKLGWTHIFSSSMVNEFRFGFSRYNFSHQPSEPVTLSDIGATRANSSSVPAAYNLIIGTSGEGFSIGTGVNDNRGGAFNTFYPADDFSITRGKHLIRLGMDASRYQLNRFNNFGTRGSVSFIDQNGLNAFQNFLLGNIGNEQAGEGFTAFHFRATDFSAYIQDDWKVTPRFTLNLGLRWEGLSTAHELNNFLSNFAGLEDGTQQIIHIIHPQALGSPFGTPGVSNCTLKNCFSSGNYAPRVGFAWDLSGNQKTVLRSGYGIYYQRISNQSLLQTAGGLPFQASLSLEAGATPENPYPLLLPPSAFPLPTDQSIPALTGFDGTTGAPIFAGGGPLTSTFFFPVRDLRPPYAQQWNLTLQRELLRNWVLEVGYVGTTGSHLLTGRPFDAGQICTIAKPCTIPASIGSNVNVPAGTPFVTKNPDGSIAITGSTRANIDARVPVQYLGELDENLLATAEEGRSHYHSLQATLSHKFSSGLYFQGAYTWSKSIDNTSGSTFQDELNGTLVSLFGDPNTLKYMHGLSDFDRTHRLVVSYDYELPIGKWMGIGNQGFGRFVNGWGIHGFTTFQSGTPFTVFDPSALELSDPNGFFGTNFATLAPGQTLQSILTTGSVQSRIGGWFNSNAFLVGGICLDAQTVSVPCQIPDPKNPGKFIANPAAQGAALGNVGRNAFRGPFQQDWDMALTKQTKITERFGTEFRAEAFNLFNHPSFQSPQAFGAFLGNYGFVNAAGGPGFSSILGTVSRPRILQLALKLTF